MDYFSELMESYSKLKKRTFKLTYISEAEEGKKKVIKSHLLNPIATSPATSNRSNSTQQKLLTVALLMLNARKKMMITLYHGSGSSHYWASCFISV